MKKVLMTYFAALLFPLSALAGTYTFSGRVIDRKNGKPVSFATVVLKVSGQWAVAGEDGTFSIGNIAEGKNLLSVSCLGYVETTEEISFSKDISGHTIRLDEDNLALESVVVTARANENSAATSRTIDRTALDHIQAMNVADISALLPGGVTTNPSLVSEQRFSIRSGGASEAGNPSFGTAVEVDGVRLSNNGSFSGTEGVATNNIASTDIESVEVISGVPSVEYGDINSGIVKINTRKGVTPYMVTMSSNPKTKQVSASKGFSLGTDGRGRTRGVVNANIEYTRAISDLMSPYTSYDRKQLSLTWSNTFSSGIFTDAPLRISASVAGNLGGYDSKADPDAFIGTYTKRSDNMLRGNFTLDWLLGRKWITNVELKGSVVYNDRQSESRTNYSSAAATVALHGREEGYFIAQKYETDPDAAAILIPAGYRYNTMCVDDRPLNYSLSLKAGWIRSFGKVNNRVKLGAEWTGDKNFGHGQYSEDMSTAPGFREWDYSLIPFMNNLAVYLEENVHIPLGRTLLSLTAGIRGENTFIRGSVYGNTSSVSPRFNARYTIIREGNAVRSLSLRAGWGTAVKLPSFSILYPTPSYEDIRVFNPTTSADGSAYYAYYVRPRTIEYNGNLRWQKSRQAEIGIDADFGIVKVSLSGYYSRILDSYFIGSDYERFSYNYTDQTNLELCTIPVDDRVFSIDRETGIVTVSDASGKTEPQVLGHSVRNSFVRTSYADNSISPITRYGLEWVLDFKKIRAINTTVRIDGSFYGYRSADMNIIPSYPSVSLSADGSPFKYVGYYIGGDSISNGRETMTVNTNLTVTTHIPRIRLILSLRLEATLHDYSRYLSDGDGIVRSYVREGQQDYFPLEGAGDIYSGRYYTVMYPKYYVSFDNPEPRDFLEDFKWAAENGRQLYTDLSRLVVRSNYLYFFSKDYISPYFSANFSVTKEIGDMASVSVYANNFFNNYGQVYSTRTGQYSPVGSRIPSFFYGMTVRLKF